MRKLHIILSLALSASVASFAQEAATSQSLPAPRVGDIKSADGRISASNSLIASELSLGPTGRAGANGTPRSKPHIDLTVRRCHQRRYLSNNRTYRLLFRPEAITMAKRSLPAAKCVQLTYT